MTDTPTGLTMGGDVQGRWGTLDDSVWTPPVRVKDNPRIPGRLKGKSPLPGSRRGTILLPGVPEKYSGIRTVRAKVSTITSEHSGGNMDYIDPYGLKTGFAETNDQSWN